VLNNPDNGSQTLSIYLEKSVLHGQRFAEASGSINVILTLAMPTFLAKLSIK
jgi:hypothetical protein